MSRQDPAFAELFRDWIENGGDDQKSEAFVRASRSLFTSIVRRVASQFGSISSQEVEDQLQDIYLKLTSQGSAILAKMPKDPEAARSYLRIVAANVCRDAWKAKHAGRRDSGRTIPFDGMESRLSQAGVRYIETRLTLQKIDQLLADRRERIVFGLYFRQGYSAAEIAQIPVIGLSVKGVESLILRVTTRLREDLGIPKKEGISDGSSS
jgi:RNA polymerase sigma-70 factor (ECF subfamily)